MIILVRRTLLVCLSAGQNTLNRVESKARLLTVLAVVPYGVLQLNWVIMKMLAVATGFLNARQPKINSKSNAQ